jgi:hypothetical protein
MRKKLESMVVLCAKELDALDADWAIGGAVAMGVHGYERATTDVDMFIGDDVREDILARLRTQRVPIVEAMAPIHYAIIPDTKHPDERVDLLFPALGVESLAIMAAKRAPLFGASLPIWPLPHVAAAKLVVDPELDPERALKDGADLRELRDRGMLDVARIGDILDDVGDRAARTRLHALIRGEHSSPDHAHPPRVTRRRR